jgi:hypothetical protein
MANITVLAKYIMIQRTDSTIRKTNNDQTRMINLTTTINNCQTEATIIRNNLVTFKQEP